MKKVLEDLKIKDGGPIKLFCDNKSSVGITHNLVEHNTTKHIKIDQNFIKKLESVLINI